MSVEMMDFPRTYAVRTLGCQMNEHDSERISGLLEKAGLVPVERVPAAAAPRSIAPSRAQPPGRSGN